MGLYANLNQQQAKHPAAEFRIYRNYFFSPFLNRQRRQWKAEDCEKKDCFLIEWLNLAELGLKLFTYQICASAQNETANTEVFASMEKEVLRFIVFPHITNEIEA